MERNNIGLISKLLLVVTSIMLVISIFVPIWRIELDAPQYPEGLMLQIYSYKIGGQVDIINGLNHYIGMATLHTENFIEFTILPYIIGFYALLMLVTALVGKKKLLIFSFSAFLIFGIVAMIDFYRWEYNYGHNLDPNAAIIVPGMAYQPPLIGFKQLLNFGAYSIPDIGGWLFIAGGLMVLAALILEIRKGRGVNFNANLLILGAIASFVSSCDNSGPKPIKLNYDQCHHCGMTISDGRFGAEIVTHKGRAYKFDDISCLMNHYREMNADDMAGIYVHDYSNPNNLIDALQCVYIEHENFKSPMRGNMAAFEKVEDAEIEGNKYGAVIRTWGEVFNQQ